MRILVATDLWFPDHRGGAARVARDTALQLAARGHELTVVAPAREGRPEREELDGVVLLRRLRRGALPHLASDIIRSRAVARRLGTRHDVLLAHQATVGYGFATARTGLPLVLVRHGSPSREARLEARQLRPGARWARRVVSARALKRLERSAASRARRVVVLSEYMAGLTATDFPGVAERVTVVRGGLDASWLASEPDRATARAALGVEPGAALVLAVRRLEHGLGLETALRAFHLLLERRDAQLVLVGGGRLASELETLAEGLGVRERVRLAGPQDGDALRCWYRAADVFVLPPAPHEGFGMATIEALASGTPPVVANVGSNPELVRPLDPRLVASSDSPADMAEALAAALERTGPELRAACSEYAASGFAWEHVIEDWERVLLEAAGPRRAD
jgi:glycosyltransferase involved in cell wall biosynthesis